MSNPVLDFLNDGIHPEPGAAIIYTIKKENVNVRFEVIPSEHPDFRGIIHHPGDISHRRIYDHYP